MENISQFLQIKEELADHLSTVAIQLKRLGAISRISYLEEKESELLHNDFRVLICGEFKRGKSCLLNSLIGENILPMKIAPCTGTVTEVRHGSLPKLTLLPTHDAPFEANFSELRKYTTIQGQKGDLLHKVIVDYPSEICQKSITLIDSPGLNEDWSRTKASLREIATADALVLVLSCEMALSRSEQQFIESHLRQYKHRLFFLWNRADAIWDKPAEQKALEQRSTQYLKPYSDRIFYVSAREALLGQLQGNIERFQRSNLSSFIDSLESYLIQESATSKLQPYWKIIADSITYAQETLVPRLDRLLKQPLHELERLQEETTQTVQNLHLKRKEIQATLKEMNQDVIESFIEILDQYIAQLSDLAFDASEAIEFPAFVHRQEREDIILAWFDQWFQNSLQDLAHTQIRQKLEKQFEEVRRDIDHKRQHFYQSLYETLQEDADVIILFEGRWVQELSIILSTSLSLLFVNTGREKVLNSLLKVQALRGWLTGKKLMDSDRRKLANQLQVSFQKERESLIFTQRSFLEEELEKTGNWLDQELARTIDDAKEQINFALDIRKNGIQNTEEHRIELEQTRLALYSIQTKLLEVQSHVCRTGSN